MKSELAEGLTGESSAENGGAAEQRPSEWIVDVGNCGGEGFVGGAVDGGKLSGVVEKIVQIHDRRVIVKRGIGRNVEQVSRNLCSADAAAGVG